LYFLSWMYHSSGSWRSSWAGEGVGALLNQGQHILDIWQWLIGMPTSIYAVIPYGKYNDFMVDDEATLLIEYPQQRTAT
ncbi:Gfo/Idh/MocA family oxidoreductase, partial [Faecalibacterium prausnitzii]|uniref:Gfo/Idh/MocA family protein n=1 Tax=Faecalibacterium prausnitzii TaxID=853 RepID=UPI00210C62BA